MDNSIVQNFARLRMLHSRQQSVPSQTSQASPSMEALAHDLTSALEESTATSRNAEVDEDTLTAPPAKPIHSRRRAWRRRCKSTSNLSNLTSSGLNQTDESSTSSADEGDIRQGVTMGTSSLQLSDSDDMGPPMTFTLGHRSKDHFMRKKKSGSDQGGAASSRHLPIESDSVNENLSPLRPSTKRKRKFKRMALDPSPSLSSPTTVNAAPKSTQANNLVMKRQKIRSHPGLVRLQQQQLSIVVGKRKRSNREKSVEPDHLIRPSTSASSLSLVTGHTRRVQADNVAMDCDDDMEQDGQQSSSSLSSSEWDEQDSDAVESFNNGREADDEQSDWPGHHEFGGSVMTDPEDEGSEAMGLLSDTLPLTATARQAYLARMKRLAECVPGREIRAGTRKLRDRQVGFTIKSSSSEQLSRFLQDPTRSELKLSVLRAPDRNKIMHLAHLYSLSVRCEGSNLLVLSKTGRTVRLKEFAVPGTPVTKNPIEFKRRRRTPPNSPLLEGSSTSNEPPTSPQDLLAADNSSSVDMASVSCDRRTSPIMNRSESPILGATEFKDNKAKFSGSLSN